MGSCSSKPGEVGSMPQEGSGSAAPMDPAAIEAVRATSSSRKQPFASPERPVTPYDRRVVSHDASRPTPSSRSPLAREPSEGGGTSPPRRGARSTATHGARASSSAARLAAMTHGDAWPPPLEGERARDPRGDGAETSQTRRGDGDDDGDDASVVVYSLDGTVSTVRVPPVLSPGDASHAPSDRALQGLGSRLGAKKRALPGGRLPGSRPRTGEPRPGFLAPTGSRPGTREGLRCVTASEVMDAMVGTRVPVAANAVRRDGGAGDDEREATGGATAASPASEDAFPERSGPFAFETSSLDGSASSDSGSDDEPFETLAMARERARREENKAGVADAARETGAENAGDGDAPPLPPPRPEPEIQNFSDFAADAPRLRMATLASGPAPRPVSREAGRMPPPPPRPERKQDASPLKPPRAAPAPTPRGPAAASDAAAAADASAAPKRATTLQLEENLAEGTFANDKKSPLEEALEAWGVSLPDSPSAKSADGGDLVAVDDEDDDLLAAFGADADAAAEGTAATTRASTSGSGRTPFRDAIPESSLVTSPLELSSSPLSSSPLSSSPLSSSPLPSSPLGLGGEGGEKPRAFPSEKEKDASPPRDFHSGSSAASADENAPEPRGARGASGASAARETGGFADADDPESLAWLRKTMRDAETENATVKTRFTGGPERVGDAAGVLRETRSASFARGNAENALRSETGSLPDSIQSLRVDGADARAAAKKETRVSLSGASRPETATVPPRDARASSPGARDSRAESESDAVASPRATALRKETVAAYGGGTVSSTRASRSRRKSKIPPPPSVTASVITAAAEGATDTEAERAETAGAVSARKSARRLANPKSRLPPPPPTRRDAETSKAPDGEAASRAAAAARSTGAAKNFSAGISSRPVRVSAGISSDASAAVQTAKTAGTRLASTTAAGYSPGAAAGKGRTEKRTTKPTKPKPAASEKPTKPAARPGSTARDASKAHLDDAEVTPAVPAEPAATDDAPAPSATPAKLKKGALASAPPAMTKAEEARARLRGSRQRRSIAGVASSVSASSAVAVSPAANVSAAPSASAQAPPKQAGTAEWGLDPAAAAAAAKLASKLGSVSVMKPRGSTSSKESAAEKAEKRAADAARRAEHAAAFAKAAAEAEAAKAAAAAAAKEAAAREAEHRIAGVDEAEMVLRVGSLADEKTLVSARQAVRRMRALLDDVTRLSRELKCEPQHVYGHVLHRLGFPTDGESRELPLERAVGAERAREMCAGVSEVRSLLRIKVQDNNDLRLAQTALCETSSFFERLDAFAAKKNKTPSEVLAAQAGGEHL